MTGAAFRAPEPWSQGGRQVDWGDWRWLGQREGVGDGGITESPRLQGSLQIIQSSPSSTTEETSGRLEQELGTSTGSRSPPSLALAFLCRASSAPANVLMWELCTTEICLLCKTQRKWVGAGAAAFPAQGRDAGGSEGSQLGRVQGRAHSGSQSCPGAGRSRPSAFPSQVQQQLRKHEDPA